MTINTNSQNVINGYYNNIHNNYFTLSPRKLFKISHSYTVINAHLRSADVGGVSDGSAGGNGDGGEDGGDGRFQFPTLNNEMSYHFQAHR
ncbi:hypothetical protein RIR_jg32860.t1 [Rhizophagus irregularis DAOM 181602=DAOM 197198]|nr:hypothetical protein RIR_jg32860.t1 [Rhizophagus irregularis DAOM 181602=DAOM 197198]